MFHSLQYVLLYKVNTLLSQLNVAKPPNYSIIQSVPYLVVTTTKLCTAVHTLAQHNLHRNRLGRLCLDDILFKSVSNLHCLLGRLKNKIKIKHFDGFNPTSPKTSSPPPHKCGLYQLLHIS